MVDDPAEAAGSQKGVVSPPFVKLRLTKQHRRAFEEHCAPASWQHFEALLFHYVFERDVLCLPQFGGPRASPSIIATELAGVENEARQLLRRLASLTPAACTELGSFSKTWRVDLSPEAAIAGSTFGLGRQVLEDLIDSASGAAQLARREVKVGRQIEPRVKLATAIARLIQAADLPLDAAATGPLCFAYQTALEVVGETQADRRVDKTLRQAIKFLSNQAGDLETILSEWRELKPR
jgi:hypothetical protein